MHTATNLLGVSKCSDCRNIVLCPHSAKTGLDAGEKVLRFAGVRQPFGVLGPLLWRQGFGDAHRDCLGASIWVCSLCLDECFFHMHRQTALEVFIPFVVMGVRQRAGTKVNKQKNAKTHARTQAGLLDLHLNETFFAEPDAPFGRASWKPPLAERAGKKPTVSAEKTPIISQATNPATTAQQRTNGDVFLLCTVNP